MILIICYIHTFLRKNMTDILIPYINQINLGNGTNLLIVETLNRNNIHMFYNEEKTIFSDIVNSFWDNYSCKGVNKNNIDIFYKSKKIDETYYDKKVSELCSALDKLSLKMSSWSHNNNCDDINVNLTYEDKNINTNLSALDGTSGILSKIRTMFNVNGNIIIKKNGKIINIMDIFNCKDGDNFIIEKNVPKNINMEISIKTLTGVTKSYMINTDDYTYSLIEKMFGNTDADARFIWKGQTLSNEYTFGNYGIQKDDVIHCVLRLRGGMFHETSGKNGNYENLSNIIVYVNMDNVNMNNIKKID